MSTHICKNLSFLLFLSIVGAFITGCRKEQKQIAKNDIQFDSIKIDKTYHLLDNPKNPNCNLQIDFIFPANYKDKETLKKIQEQFVYTYFGDKYDTLPPRDALTKYTEAYMESYKKLENDFKNETEKDKNASVETWFSYYEITSGKIAFNKDNFLSYIIKTENYTGGAHGSHAINNHVISLPSGKMLTEEDIFIDNYQDELARLLVEHIAKQNKVEDPKELENIGYFSVDEISPNGNFLIDERGITYTFNEYEIAAYVVGVTNVFLPFEELQSLIRTDGPLSKFITPNL